MYVSMVERTVLLWPPRWNNYGYYKSNHRETLPILGFGFLTGVIPVMRNKISKNSLMLGCNVYVGEAFIEHILQL